MRSETFTTPGPLLLSVRIPSGEIDIETADGEETQVELQVKGKDGAELEEAARIELRPRREGHEVVVELERKGFRIFGWSSGDVRVQIRAPHGAEVKASGASADVEGRGRFGAVDIDTASGDVAFDQIEGEAKVNSASGDVRLVKVEGGLIVNTASGDVDVGYVGGEGKLRSASGDVAVREAAGSLKVQTASGDQEVGSVVAGQLTMQSASGDMEIGVKQGSKVWIDARSMSGETTSELPVGDAAPEGDGPLVEINATAMSGDVHVRRA